MPEFEIIFAEKVIAEDFFDAVEIAQKKQGVEILTVSAIPPEVDEDVFDE